MIRSYFVLTILTGGIFLVSATSLPAENGAFDKMYGDGVHAFFTQDYAKAHECLTRAIDAGSKNPRCFYFRGLAYLKLGREPEARSDFAAAADLEARDAYAFYDVSRALERIQGKARAFIEQYRGKARLAAAARAEKLRQARYEELRRAEAEVLEQQAEAAPAKPLEVEAAKAADPFSAGPIEDEAPKPAEPTAVENTATGKTTDPFAVAPDAASKPAEPATKPAAKGGNGEDPFGDDQPPAKETKPAPKKQPAPKQQPAPKKAEPVDPDDPFA